MKEFDSWVLILYKIIVHRQTALILLFNSQPSTYYLVFKSDVSLCETAWQCRAESRRVLWSKCAPLPNIWILERRPAPWKGGVPFRVKFGPGALSPLQIKKCHFLRSCKQLNPNSGLENELEREPRIHLSLCFSCILYAFIIRHTIKAWIYI